MKAGDIIKCQSCKGKGTTKNGRKMDVLCINCKGDGEFIAARLVRFDAEECRFELTVFPVRKSVTVGSVIRLGCDFRVASESELSSMIAFNKSVKS